MPILGSPTLFEGSSNISYNTTLFTIITIGNNTSIYGVHTGAL